MKTRWRLLLMFVTCAGLFAGTWYGLKRAERAGNQQPPPEPKTTQELLIGRWSSSHESRNPAGEIHDLTEFTADGKVIVRLITPIEGTAGPHHGADALRLRQALNRIATTVYRPNRHGPARRTVFLHHPRVLSRPKQLRASWNVVSMFQRPQ
jgi:hypothetical protein